MHADSCADLRSLENASSPGTRSGHQRLHTACEQGNFGPPPSQLAHPNPHAPWGGCVSLLASSSSSLPLPSSHSPSSSSGRKGVSGEMLSAWRAALRLGSGAHLIVECLQLPEK